MEIPVRKEDDMDLAATMSKYKTAFQIDKERISNSTAFRRLEYKTQVFVSHEGDHYRTRLTHTIEVAETARLIAQALQLNEDLVEAISLGHDLGHTPIGHVGEETLNELFAESLRDSGSEEEGITGAFYHNVQSVRVADSLEKGFEWDQRRIFSESVYDPEEPSNSRGYGLDLCWAVREGILKHSARGLRKDDAAMYGSKYILDDLGRFEPATLEGQVVEYADEIASMMHDIEDGLRSRLFTLKALRNQLRERLKDLHESDDELERAFGLSKDFLHPEIQDSPKSREDYEANRKSRLAKMKYVLRKIISEDRGRCPEDRCTVGLVIGFLRTLFISNLIEASTTRIIKAMTGELGFGHWPTEASIKEATEEGERLLVLIGYRGSGAKAKGDVPAEACEFEQTEDMVAEAFTIARDGARRPLFKSGNVRIYWSPRCGEEAKDQKVIISEEESGRSREYPLGRCSVIFQDMKLIGYTKRISTLSNWLRKEFISEYLHKAPIVIRMGEKGKMWMNKLFKQFLDAPLSLPKVTMQKYKLRILYDYPSPDEAFPPKKTFVIDDNSRRRPVSKDPKCVLRVIEHLQGMTDRYLAEEHARLFLDQNRMGDAEELSIVDTEAGSFLHSESKPR